MKRTAAFTLTEILVALAVLGTVMAVIIPSYNNTRKVSFDTATTNCHKVIFTELTAYRARNGSYPSNISALSGDVTEACGQAGVQVTGHNPDAPGPPAKNATGNGVVTPYGNSFILYTWHPGGTKTVLSSPYEGVRMRDLPYP